YHEFAVLLAQTGNFKAAETEFIRVIEIDPAYTEAYLNLGLTYRTLGKPDQAIAVLRQGIDADPRNAALRAMLGQLWLGQQNLGAAVQELQLAVTLNPTCAECFNNLGVALVQQGKSAEALQAFEQAVKLNPKYLGAVQNLERLRQQLKP
nr:tetratricopeptide repeat protein [Acidobacteriota bacterium]